MESPVGTSGQSKPLRPSRPGPDPGVGPNPGGKPVEASNNLIQDAIRNVKEAINKI